MSVLFSTNFLSVVNHDATITFSYRDAHQRVDMFAVVLFGSICLYAGSERPCASRKSLLDAFHCVGADNLAVGTVDYGART